MLNFEPKNFKFLANHTPKYMFKMLLGSNANFLCSNLPYNTHILEISEKSQPNLSMVMLIGAMLIKKTMCISQWLSPNHKLI